MLEHYEKHLSLGESPMAIHHTKSYKTIGVRLGRQSRHKSEEIIPVECSSFWSATLTFDVMYLSIVSANVLGNTSHKELYNLYCSK